MTDNERSGGWEGILTAHEGVLFVNKIVRAIVSIAMLVLAGGACYKW